MVIHYVPGIICEELTVLQFCAVKLETDEKMTIGYIAAQSVSYEVKWVINSLKRLSKYKDKVFGVNNNKGE